MKRRQLIFGTVLSLLAAPRVSAQGAWGRGWTKIPSVSVLVQGQDERARLTQDAVDYWNRTLTDIGSKFHLGQVTSTAGAIPAGELATLSAAVLSRSGTAQLPRSALDVPGDIVVALSDGDFISFCYRSLAQQKALVGIRSGRLYPLILPNVARNVIAHELGHAIGLGHNADPTKLMCGRPAPCRPDAFTSQTARYFPLTGEEKAALLAMYPASWAAQ